uniref:Uncharacterized protein n=1 Tax=Ananas comosus var. bracteatus TaxID=296719 RepID=A0A6V7P0I9_ANACO|nr:unnamed protein product [Ananas comosus var. bracteatus]
MESPAILPKRAKRGNTGPEADHPARAVGPQDRRRRLRRPNAVLAGRSRSTTPPPCGTAPSSAADLNKITLGFSSNARSDASSTPRGPPLQDFQPRHPSIDMLQSAVLSLALVHDRT